MSQHDYNIANSDGATVRSDINSALSAIVSLNSGASAPSTTFAYQWWADTTNNLLKRRNAADSAWLIVGPLAGTVVLPKTGAYTIALGDFGKMIDADASGGDFTLTLPAAATAGDGFTVAVKNTGSSGTVTIDGDGSEIIDGATTVALSTQYAGAVLRCDGSEWHIEAGSTFGLEQGLRTIWVPATAMQSVTTDGATPGIVELAINDVMLVTRDFDAATEEHVQFSIHMPKSWDEGTITAQFVWSAASGSGDVVWGLESNAVGNDDALDAAFGTAQTATDTLLTADDEHHSPVTSAITIGGTPAENDRVVFQAFRKAADGGDTLGVDARLIGVSIFYGLNAGNDA